jgi:DUF917 family protein
MAERDGEILVTTPDLITVLDAESGLPVTADALRYGLLHRAVEDLQRPRLGQLDRVAAGGRVDDRHVADEVALSRPIDLEVLERVRHAEL